MRLRSWLALASLPLLSGCVLPPAVAIASYVIDAGSYATTGKSSTDHLLSWVAQEDCALLRIFEGEICSHETVYEAAAPGILEPLPPGGSVQLGKPQPLTALIDDPAALPSLAHFSGGDPALGPLLAEGRLARTALLGGAVYLADGVTGDPVLNQLAATNQ